MKSEEKGVPRRLIRRLQACKDALGEVGIVLPGTVTVRYVPCGKKGCRCQGRPPRLHGPYYQWTRKVAGKTRTVRLTKEEARTYRAWIKGARRLGRLVSAWQAVGIEAAELIRKKRQP